MLITKMLVGDVTPWLIIGVALITLILGLVAGAVAAYKLIPNSAKKQAESIII